MEQGQSFVSVGESSVTVAKVEEKISTEDLAIVKSNEKVSDISNQGEANIHKDSENQVDSHKDATELKNRLLLLKQKKDKEKARASNYVRIDNFQRPLTAKGLVQWLRETLNVPLSDSDIWINQIKTHCYVDFSSIGDAMRCVKTITGLKFPATNTNTLVADYTQISVKDAPTSVEAQLLPGKWKDVITEKSGDSTPKAQTNKVNGFGAAFGIMRKAVEKAAEDTQKNNSNPQQVVVSRKVDEIRLVKRPNSPIKNEPSGQTQKIIFQESELPAKKLRVAENPLDKLFKKTTAKPQLYWLPVSETEIQRRRELTKLMKEKQ